MAKWDVTTLFKALLLQFIGEEDPLLSMLQWMTQTLMQVEAENKVEVERSSWFMVCGSWLASRR